VFSINICRSIRWTTADYRGKYLDENLKQSGYLLMRGDFSTRIRYAVTVLTIDADTFSLANCSYNSFYLTLK